MAPQKTSQEQFTELCAAIVSTARLSGELDKAGFVVHSVYNRVDSSLVKAVHKASGAAVSGVVFKGISAKDRAARRAAEAANK